MDTTRSSPCESRLRPEEIARRARALVEAQLHLAARARAFDFSVCDGVLVVRGTVPTFYLKQVLQSALKDMEGIRGIDFQVTVAAVRGCTKLDNGLS